jgi:hypothetical protein
MLHGEGSLFTCACGLKNKIDKMGYLSGGPFRAVDEWGLWQKEKLRELIQQANRAELYRDGEQEIVRILPGHQTATVQQGTLSVSRVGLNCGGFTLQWSRVLGVEVFGKNSVVFSDDQGNHYQLLSNRERSGLKYLDTYRIMAMEKEGSD